MEKKVIIETSLENVILIERALEFYSRIGIGQLDVIKDHATFEKYLSEVCTPKKEIEVGDKTPQGRVEEIQDGKALISGSVKDGKWNEEWEWKKLEDVKLSTDYSKYHALRDQIDNLLLEAKKVLTDDKQASIHGGWGIYNPAVDESCRISFDIQQVLRHERWKLNPNSSSATVDSHVHFSSPFTGEIKCEIK